MVPDLWLGPARPHARGWADMGCAARVERDVSTPARLRKGAAAQLDLRGGGAIPSGRLSQRHVPIQAQREFPPHFASPRPRPEPAGHDPRRILTPRARWRATRNRAPCRSTPVAERRVCPRAGSCTISRPRPGSWKPWSRIMSPVNDQAIKQRGTDRTARLPRSARISAQFRAERDCGTPASSGLLAALAEDPQNARPGCAARERLPDPHPRQCLRPASGDAGVSCPSRPAGDGPAEHQGSRPGRARTRCWTGCWIACRA